VAAPRGKGRARSAPWTREECIVVWTACPTRSEDYHSKDPPVRELADLTGRSPGSVALKMANFWWHLSGGTKGFRNGGEMTRLVYNEFRERGVRLTQADASARLDIADSGGSVRTESVVPSESVDGLRSEVIRLVRRTGFPEDGVTPYTRPGSVIFGVYVDPLTILSSFASAVTLGRELSQLGRDWTESRALRSLREGDHHKFLLGEARYWMPDLNASPLAPDELQAVVDRLVRIRRKIRLPKNAGKALAQLSRNDVVPLVKETLHVDPSNLDSASLWLLGRLASERIRPEPEEPN
jgi:hypothetical protein